MFCLVRFKGGKSQVHSLWGFVNSWKNRKPSTLGMQSWAIEGGESRVWFFLTGKKGIKKQPKLRLSNCFQRFFCWWEEFFTSGFWFGERCDSPFLTKVWFQTGVVDDIAGYSKDSFDWRTQLNSTNQLNTNLQPQERQEPQTPVPSPPSRNQPPSPLWWLLCSLKDRRQVQKELCQAMASTPKDLQQELKDLLGVGPI